MSTLRTLSNAMQRFYGRLTRQPEEGAVRDAMEALEQAPVFRSLARPTLRELTASVHMRSYRRDEFIYYEDDPGLGLYLVQRGRVRLLTEDRQGTTHELWQVGEHDLFGELSLMGDFRRMETAQAVLDTQVLGFFRPDLLTIVRRNPKAGAEVTAALARYLAARQVEVMRLVAERDGRLAALRMFEGAAHYTVARE